MSNALKLAIDIGHNAPYDGGAIGIKSEDSLNLDVGTKLIGKCSAAGIEVINCAPNNVQSLFDSLNKRVGIANDSKADFFISIHHNAFPGANGTEILCIPGGGGEEVSKIILPEIIKLGFTNRGVKARHDLYVLNETNMSAILIECAFCDSEIDMRSYDAEKMASSIFNGICKAFNIPNNMGHIPESNKTIDEGIYHVVRKGDNLWVLSKQYNTTVKNLIALNSINDPNLIYIGQRIRVR
ncbi:N-acetylmuramoyl-L-alanine amidase [Clostridium paridis]|uniref:N-acetylmuramoyl-L-alanine amidase n=1 Tax=Clostridium paridis TaxID=2803863 RepID=A0A937FIZ7_9CLOT|nr:N-acetylmuramoyl-L-alanine amidase [Clostridium paridis]MBL4933048.1 N-acetylmuramoyl-L-alanine amidase [Clostridium paridis]